MARAAKSDLRSAVAVGEPQGAWVGDAKALHRTSRQRKPYEHTQTQWGNQRAGGAPAQVKATLPIGLRGSHYYHQRAGNQSCSGPSRCMKSMANLAQRLAQAAPKTTQSLPGRRHERWANKVFWGETPGSKALEVHAVDHAHCLRPAHHQGCLAGALSPRCAGGGTSSEYTNTRQTQSLQLQRKEIRIATLAPHKYQS